MDSFDVLLESCPSFQQAISIQTLRVLVASLNARLGKDKRIDVVTGWSREIPGTERTDPTAVAWITAHEDDDDAGDGEEEAITMLTFNFSYAEGNRELPPYSDAVLLEWCRHYKVS